jgi:hypothetical protein
MLELFYILSNYQVIVYCKWYDYICLNYLKVCVKKNYLKVYSQKGNLKSYMYANQDNTTWFIS